jgi:hypothetical protein
MTICFYAKQSFTSRIYRYFSTLEVPTQRIKLAGRAAREESRISHSRLALILMVQEQLSYTEEAIH